MRSAHQSIARVVIFPLKTSEMIFKHNRHKGQIVSLHAA